MDDAAAMRAAIAAAADRPHEHGAEPLGRRRRRVRGRLDRRHRAPPSRPAARTPSGSPCAAAGDAARGATLVTHAGALQPPRPHAAVRRRDRRGRHRPGRRRHRGPRPPRRRRRASPRCGPPASTSRSASRPTRSPSSWRRTSSTAAPAARTSCSSWPPPSTAAPPPPTARASGSPAPRPAPTPTACGPRAAPSSSAPAPCGPTTRRSPCATSTDPDPLRVVLGRAPAGAKVHPCLERSGDLGAVLDELGGRGVLQLLVEGGATVAHAFHAAGLVDRYVVYLAPAVFGGDDARGPVPWCRGADDRRRCHAAGSPPSAAWATTCAWIW